MVEGYYKADINGVQFCGSFYDLLHFKEKIQTPEHFVSQLDCLEEDAIIYTYLDEDDTKIYKQIVEEWGMND